MANETDAELAARAPLRRVVAVGVDGEPIGAGGASGLTDAQLRASAVPVSGPLTDTQLRATAVPVSGPLTDTQLRATAIPVSRTAGKLETTTRTPLWATGQHVVTSATSAKTAAITGTEVMISLSADAYINIGTQSSITATKGAGSMFLAKGGPYTFQITSGQGVAVIMDSAAGVMSAVPVA